MNSGMLFRPIMAVLATAALSLPAAASATWKIDGRGFGHGVGLSQYGALGFAEHGRSYRQILRHYYSGTRLGKVGGGSGDPGGGTTAGRRSGRSVRVLLGSGSERVGFSGATRACGKRIKPTERYDFVADGRAVELRSGARRIAGCGDEGRASDRVIRIEGFGTYRGSLVARPSGDGDLLVINQLGLEAYVKGVVPNEVPPAWPAQALRAQAVVARSYGIATERSGPFDHYDDTRSQVYGGKSSETKTTNRAVEGTAGEVVQYNGKTAVTYYFSTSGGKTENSEFGFSGGSRIPYLRAVKDPYDDASPVHSWTETLSDSEMEAKLRGLFSGSLQRIEIVDTGRSPRIVRARVVGSGGSQTVSGDTLRSRLGLRSTWARFKHN